MQKNRKIANVNEKECVACGSCIKVCPFGAITVPKGIVAEVEKLKCVGCGLCAKTCPASCILIVKNGLEEGYEK